MSEWGPSPMSTRHAPVSKYAAPDGKHYWNCWTNNYQAVRDGYCIHVFCEEDRTGRTCCGVIAQQGGGESYPLDGRPSCLKCRRIMIKRGALLDTTLADTNRYSTAHTGSDGNSSGKNLGAGGG